MGRSIPAYCTRSPLGSGGHLGLYRIETQVTAGNGSLKMSGFGSNSQAKEAIKVGFDYFKANANPRQRLDQGAATTTTTCTSSNYTTPGRRQR